MESSPLQMAHAEAIANSPQSLQPPWFFVQYVLGATEYPSDKISCDTGHSTAELSGYMQLDAAKSWWLSLSLTQAADGMRHNCFKAM